MKKLLLAALFIVASPAFAAEESTVQDSDDNKIVLNSIQIEDSTNEEIIKQEIELTDDFREDAKQVKQQFIDRLGSATSSEQIEIIRQEAGERQNELEKEAQEIRQNAVDKAKTLISEEAGGLQSRFAALVERAASVNDRLSSTISKLEIVDVDVTNIDVERRLAVDSYLQAKKLSEEAKNEFDSIASTDNTELIRSKLKKGRDLLSEAKNHLTESYESLRFVAEEVRNIIINYRSNTEEETVINNQIDTISTTSEIIL